ncbi:MAG: hypothetical protein J6X79_06305 [Bacteroidales bacterium]|nr:hypothetical protein [Bacteroidales bacterium]
MKKALSMMCLAALMVGMSMTAQAQFRQSIFLNGNLPTGSFASSINTNHPVPLGYQEIGKAATLGFGAGYRASYRFDVGLGMVAPFAQADLFWNMIGSTWRNKYMDNDYTTPTYFNIPVIAGVSYLYDELWNDITPYGEFGVGADFMMITSEGKGTGTAGGTLYYAYKPNIAFAWMIGLGAYFGRHVSAGLYYYGLGTHPIDYTKKTLDENNLAAAEVVTHQTVDGVLREKRSIGSLALRIGFHF